MSTGELILYTTEDGATQLHLRAEDGTVWLMQAEIATLFQTTKQNISLHAKNVLAEGELVAEAVIKERLTTASDGKNYRTLFYNLDMILAIGYRVRSHRGTQFRQWATAHLREFLVKGFVMDDARLKDPAGWDYFDELLERIREIRASEKRFYQKVRDIYTTAVDYDGKSDAAKLFFSKVQNKMLWAITGRTAAELISQRADPAQPNMGLQSWKGARVRQQDVTTAKNYLGTDELHELDRIVVMYLDYAEDQARRRKAMTMQEWENKLDAFLTFNERDVLTHAGQISAQIAEQLALDRYAQFDAQRRDAERLAADAQDAALLTEVERALQRRAPAKKHGNS
ncbi:virulence RhuM family protein [Ralstonia sp.]|uniref:virulence RhuM family protein n=1 Tax=Ralstonia sp. TaxID=54061 RepID=UPI0031DC9277